MRVLISSYSPTGHSSYGTVTRELWTRLMKSGEFKDIVQHGWFTVNSLDPVPWQVVPTQNVVTPNKILTYDPEDHYGQSSFETLVQKFKPDIVWNLSDIYMSRYLDAMRRKYNFKLIRWTLTPGEPIDKNDLPSIRAAERCVPITKFTGKKWAEVTGEEYPHIYHGVDLDTFKPAEFSETLALRKKHSDHVHSAEDFLILYVGRNQTRKRPWLTFEYLHYLRTGAWGWDENDIPVREPWDVIRRKHGRAPRDIVKRATPIPAHLWLHSHDDGHHYNYERLVEQWNLEDKVLYTTGLSDTVGLATSDLANIYRMADVLCMTSGSEGFGVPTAEATACGVPSVYTSYAGGGEIGSVCRGVPVPYVGWEPARGSCTRWVNPDVDRAIESLYSVWKNREFYRSTEGRTALHHVAREHFDYDKIALQWLEVFRQVRDTEKVKLVGGRV